MSRRVLPSRAGGSRVFEANPQRGESVYDGASGVSLSAAGEVVSCWGWRRHQFFGVPDPGAGGTGTTMPGANGISSTAVTFVTKCRVSPKQEVGSPTFSS
jgi:hypothetical protein